MPDDLLTVAQAAARLGIAARTVRKLAAELGVGRRVGHAYVLTAADLARLPTRPRGRPVRGAIARTGEIPPRTS